MNKFITRSVTALMSAALVIGQPLSGLSALAAQTSEDTTATLAAELDVANYADQWVYYGDAPVYSKGEMTGETVYAGCYALRSIVYCSNPADADVEVMDIYVPEEYVTAYPTGEVNESGEALYHVEINEEGYLINSNGTLYTAETAPIIYQNSIDGYREGGLFEIGSNKKGASNLGYNADVVREGYVLVGVGARGTDSEVDGTAPAGIVDLKAGVRFLKANDELLPGDSNKIYATGGSAGGGSVSVLGASGNSPLFDSYLEEIGAIMDATDDIYCVLGYCPITNLDFVDAAYEWLHSSELSYTDWDDETAEVDPLLHEALIVAYEEYLKILGFDLDEYEQGFVDAMNDAVAYYIAEGYVDDVAAFVEEYSDCLTYDADGNVVVISKDALVAGTMARAKDALASDSLGADSNESALFDGKHFSQIAYEVLRDLGYEEAEEYAEDITQEQALTVYMLSPMAFLSSGSDDITIAPFWRINNGTADGDFGSVAGYTIVSYLNANNLCTAAEYNFVWGMGHGTADLSLSDIVEYVDSTVFYGE